MPPADEPVPAGPRVIPRPPDAEPGRPAPWHGVSKDRREGLTVDVLRAALVAGGRDLAAGAPPEPHDELSGVAASTTEGLLDSAVLVAAYEEAGEARVILTVRAGHLRRHRGEVSFPGGRVEPGEAPLAAAVREADEEIGLDPSVVRPLAWLRPLVTFASGSIIRPFVATLEARPDLTVAPAEVSRAFDVSLAELLCDGVFHEERWRRPSPRPGRDPDGTFPIYFFEIDGETIWGATARILTELCTLVVGLEPR